MHISIPRLQDGQADVIRRRAWLTLVVSPSQRHLSLKHNEPKKEIKGYQSSQYHAYRPATIYQVHGFDMFSREAHITC